MPTCKKPNTLYTLAVRSTVPYCVDQVGREVFNKSSESGLLDKLPRGVVEDLFIHALSREQEEKWRDEFKVFLTPRIRWAFIKWDKDLLRLVKKKCTNLQCLCLERTRCTTINVHELIDLKQRYKIVDWHSDFLWEHGVYLKQKLVQWIINDKVRCRIHPIYRMLRSRNKNIIMKITEYLETHAQWVESLLVENCSLSAKNICLILDTLPELKILTHPKVPKALHKIYQEKAKSLPEYNLINIEIRESDFQRGCNLVEAAMLCPQIKNVKVSFERKGFKALSALMLLDSINQLQVTYVWDPLRKKIPYLFSIAVVPILRKNRWKIKFLDVAGFLDVDPYLIMYLCPNLEYLNFRENSYVEMEHRLPDNLQMNHLKFFNHSCTFTHGQFSRKWFNSVCSSPMLQELTLRSTYFTEEVFDEIFLSSTNLKQLKMIVFLSCGGVTREHLEYLLTTENKLQVLIVIACHQISEVDAVDLINLVRRNNLDVHVAIRPDSTTIGI